MTPRRKIPTKAELIQLQKLYKTDEKIGERLGGVPAYLVAYWRRKKHVPKHSVPKFSEREILSLWERHGDDDRCGLELGISKAAFYNWRRRYGIRNKPAFLKLEQLELNFPGVRSPAHGASLWGKQTAGQKILARAADKAKVETGETIRIEPDLVVSHGNGNQVITMFRKHGVEYVWNPSKIVVSPDHPLLDESEQIAAAHKTIREFVKRQRLPGFCDFSEGACHQVAVEQGRVLPGHLGLGTNNDIASFGCVGCFARVIDSGAMAAVWATGKIEVEVAGALRIDISGRRSRGVYAKDVALSIIKQLTAHSVNGKVIEYFGSTLSQMTISERFTLCSLSTALAPAAVMCPFDSATRRYLTGRTSATLEPVMTDKNAVYEEMYQINIDRLTSQIACPGPPDNIKPTAELETLPVTLIILGTATNGRFDDLRIAAEILKGKKVHSECRILVYPASRATYLEALKKGLIRVLAEAGAVIMPPGLGPSDGRLWARLAGGERCLTTGDCDSESSLAADHTEVYLCSPATAAASALNAAITDPTRYVK